MDDNYYIYLVPLPHGITEAVLPCEGGYTIYLDESLTGEQLIKAYDHAIAHIDNGDLYNEGMSASEKEMRAHRLGYYAEQIRYR